jgi:peptidoglycan-associated lipoprotein
MQGATYLKTLAVVAALAAFGCKSATTDVTNIPGKTLATNGGNGNGNTGGNGGNGNTDLGPGGTGGGTGGPEITPGPGPGFGPLGLPGEHEIVRDAFQKIHFAYDSAELRPEDLPNITKVAEYLIQNPNHLLEVEGHCDERGTEDYNLSLGERRAQAIAQALSELGVTVNRLATKSMGEKMPVVQGSDEESFAANRRGEFVLYVPLAAPANGANGATPQRINLTPGAATP